MIGTNRIDGRVTASQMAAASAASFFDRLYIALHVARRHQTHGVAELGNFTRPMMSGSAGFHADQARRNLAKKLSSTVALLCGLETACAATDG